MEKQHQHLDSDGLLSAAYGLDDSAGWRDCPGCAAQVAAMSERRSARLENRVEDALPEWFWTRQREAILSSTRQAPVAALRPRWAAVVAMAGVLAAAVLISTSGTQQQPAAARVVMTAPLVLTAEDERLLSEVSTTVNRVEPQALAPMGMLWR